MNIGKSSKQSIFLHSRRINFRIQATKLSFFSKRDLQVDKNEVTLEALTKEIEPIVLRDDGFDFGART